MSTVQTWDKRKKYTSDISKNEWKNLKPELRKAKNDTSKGGRPNEDLQEIISEILYGVKTGSSWRSLPHDFTEGGKIHETLFLFKHCPDRLHCEGSQIIVPTSLSSHLTITFMYK